MTNAKRIRSTFVDKMFCYPISTKYQYDNKKEMSPIRLQRRNKNIFSLDISHADATHQITESLLSS